jgi:glutamyl-tRNA reductase
MHISVTGVSHHETPVELRERFAFSKDALAPALRRLPEGLGGAVLSTCNRSELYLTSETPIDRDEAIAALLKLRDDTTTGAEGAALEGAWGSSPSSMPLPFFHHTDADAVQHLYRVAAGIDSLVVGESEILGQVREAFSAATAAGSGNPVLARLFHSALRVGRRARSETEIGAHGLSVAALAVSLSKRLLGDLRRKTVLVVGAGEVGQRAAMALAQAGAGRLLVTTRRSELAVEIARDLSGTAIPFAEMPRALFEADVIISATAAPEAIIKEHDVLAAMAFRRERPLMIVDIAVPRDVEGSVRDVDNVHLFDIDDLQAAAEANLETRRLEVGAVETIVNEEAARFDTWLAERGVAPTIAALRQSAEATRLQELQRTLDRLPNLTADERKRLDAMTKSLVNRLLHAPVTRLRDQGSERHLDAVRELFELD